jgi:vacuolar-type H+-ATPase subunit E/Vma4
MESVEKGKAALIAGIESDAQAEEERIIKEAEKQAAEKRQYAEKKAEAILSESRQQAEEQAKAIKSRMLSDADSEIKRTFLKQQDVIMQDIIGQAEKRMASMIDDPDYRNILVNWIAEAAVGLDVESAQINASQKERLLIDEKLLSEVKEKIQKDSGKTVKLTLSQLNPLENQGVVLTATNGRIAFNNQVKTRFSRSQRKIRMIIYNTLFSDNQKV